MSQVGGIIPTHEGQQVLAVAEAGIKKVINSINGLHAMAITDTENNARIKKGIEDMLELPLILLLLMILMVHIFIFRYPRK